MCIDSVFTRKSDMKLYRVAQAVLVIWLVYKLVVILPVMQSDGIVGGIGAHIGSSVFDLRTWLLVVGLLLLRTKVRKTP